MSQTTVESVAMVSSLPSALLYVKGSVALRMMGNLTLAFCALSTIFLTKS
jgi:hypothetical protein